MTPFHHFTGLCGQTLEGQRILGHEDNLEVAIA